MACAHAFVTCLIPDYKLCSLCGTYRSTAPAVPKTLYQPGYWSGDRGSIWEQVWNVDMHTEGGVSKNRFVIERVESDRNSVLEVGCAPGRLLYWLQWAARFKEVIGVDPGATPGEIRDISSLSGEILSGFFPDATSGIRSQAFDLVAGLDVFEHATAPEAFLAECMRLLKPGGQLFLMLPLAEGLEHGSRFFNAAEHVYLHSRANIEGMFAAVGLVGLKYDRWTVGHDTVSARRNR